jgi:hypothetical protein
LVTRRGSEVARQVAAVSCRVIHGSEAVETIQFSIDGARYEIDLNAKHAKKLRDGIAKFVGGARKVSGTTKRPGRSRHSVRHSREHLQAVRDWARRQGYELSDRGRVPAAIMAEFDASH